MDSPHVPIIRDIFKKLKTLSNLAIQVVKNFPLSLDFDKGDNHHSIKIHRLRRGFCYHIHQYLQDNRALLDEFYSPCIFYHTFDTDMFMQGSFETQIIGLMEQILDRPDGRHCQLVNNFTEIIAGAVEYLINITGFDLNIKQDLCKLSQMYGVANLQMCDVDQ
jgi:hypothetical protein